MARGYIPLPAYNPGPQGINFAPLNEGMSALGGFLKENRLLSQAKDIGQAVQSGGYGPGAEAAFGHGDLSTGLRLQAAQRDIENAQYQRQRQEAADRRAAAGESRAAQSHALTMQNTQYQRQRQEAADKRAAAGEGRAAQSHKLNMQSAQDELRSKLISRTAGIAERIRNEQDPQRKQQLMTAFVNAHPRLQSQFQAYNLDPANPDPVLDMIISEARGLSGADKAKYQFTKYGIGNPATGEITPYPQSASGANSDRVKLEQSLRKEFSDLSKNFRSIQEGADRVKVGARLNNAVGDLSLIFGYMKLLDPGSVVREGEFANAENAQGVPDRIRNVWNKIVSGERLNPRTRQEFVAAAQELASAQTGRQNRVIEQFRSIAREAGLDPSRIVMDFGPSTPSQNQPSPFPEYPKARQAPDGNWYIEDPDRPGGFLRIEQ